MFGRKKRETFLVKVDCEPKLEGKVCVLFSVIMAVFFAAKFIVNGTPRLLPAIFYVGVTLFLAGVGVWFWRFKRKPRKILVVIGGRDNVLYVRSKLLYVLFEIAVFAVSYAVIVFVIEFFSNGFRFTSGSFSDSFGHYGFILLLFLYHTVQNYMGFYMYYKSPEKARRID